MDQQPDPVQVLQQKLQKLEEKYLNFVEKCSNLLKSDKITSEARDFFSECSSSYCLTPDLQSFASAKDSKHLMDLLTRLENGSLIKEVMSNVSETVQTTQEQLFRMFTFPEKLKARVKETHKSLTAEIWQSLFTYENFVQSAVKNSIRKIKELDKAFEDTLMRSDNRWVLYKEKYKQCKTEKNLLIRKIRESTDCRNDVNRKKTPEKPASNISTQQNMISSRSLVSSPAPYRDSSVHSAVKGFESTAEIKGKNKVLPPTAVGTKSALRERKVDVYDVEKKEIQEQLKSLQLKLQGFEKVAKNLIESNIRAEMKIMGKNQENADKSRSKVYESPDLSIFGSHISILDVDQLQKNVETLEKEKELVELALGNEKQANKDLIFENNEKDKKIIELIEEVKNIESELMDSQGKIKSLSDENKELKETKSKDFELQNLLLSHEKEKLEKMLQTINEGKKVLSEKIKEKDQTIDELTAEINSSKINFSAIFEKNKALKGKIKKIKEDKLKIMSFSAKYAESAKISEENIKTLQESNKKLVENEKIFNQKLEKNKEILENLENLLREAEIKEKKLLEKIEEMQKKSENWINEIKTEKEKKENLEKTWEKQKKFWESQEKDHKNSSISIKNLEKTLETKEEAIRTLEEAKKKLETSKKSLEKSLKESQQKESLLVQELEKLSETSTFQSSELKTLSSKLSETLSQLSSKDLELKNSYKQEDLTLKLSESEKNLEISRIQIEDQKKNLETCQLKLKDLQSQLFSKEKEISSLESSLFSSETTSKSLETHLKSLESKLKSLESSNTTLETSRISLSEALKTNSSQLSKQNSKLASLKQSLFESQESEKALKSELQSLKFQLKDQKTLLESSEALKCEISSLESQLSTQNSQLFELNSLKSSLKSLESQLHIKDSLLKQRSEFLSESQVQIANLESTINSLQFDLKHSKKVVEDLEKRLEKYSELEDKERNLLKENQNLQKNIQNFQKNIQNLQVHVDDLEKEELVSKEKYLNLSKQNEEILMTLSSRSESLVILKNSLKKIMTGLKNLKIFEVKKDLNELKTFIIKKNEEFKNFIMNPNQIKNFERIFSDFKGKTDELRQKNAGLTNNIQKNQMKNEELNKEITKRDEEIEGLVKSRSELSSKVWELQRNIENLTEKIRESSKSEVSQGKALKTLDLALEDSKKLSENLKTENSELFHSNQLLKSQNDDLQKKTDQLGKDLAVFNLKINEKIQEIIKLTEKNDNLQQALQDLDLNKKESENHKNLQINALTQEIHNLKQQLLDFQDLKEKLKLNQHESLKTHEENQTLHKKLEEKSKELEKNIQNLEKLRLDYEKIFKECKNFASENQRLLEIQVSFSNESKKMKEKVEEKDKEIEVLGLKLESKVKIEEDLKNALIDSQKEIEKFNSRSSVSRCENCLGKPGFITNRDDVKEIFVKSEGSDKGKSVLPVPLRSKTGSVSSNYASSNKKSILTDELNVTPAKLLRVIKHGGKKWALVNSDDGNLIWKEESELPGITLNEDPEDPEEIKVLLGDLYKGSILSSIRDLLNMIEEPDLSVHPEDNKFDLLSQSFRGEIFDAGLELSKIDIKLAEGENFEQLSQELSAKINEIAIKDKKIEKKKRTLLLHQEQIIVLKEQLRKSQEKVDQLESNAGINVAYLKQVWISFIIKVKVDKSYEELVSLLFKLMVFTTEEVNKIQVQRKGGKKLISK
jgi:chromosome segregation ATPase